MTRRPLDAARPGPGPGRMRTDLGRSSLAASVPRACARGVRSRARGRHGWRGAAADRLVRHTLCVLAVVVAAPIAGCGRASSEALAPSAGTVGNESGLEAAFITRVNAVCAKYNDRIRALGAPTGTIEEQARIAHRTNVISLQSLHAVRTVPGPPRARRRLARIIDRVRRTIRLADRSTRENAHHGASATRHAMLAAHQLGAENQALAASGFTVCAE